MIKSQDEQLNKIQSKWQQDGFQILTASGDLL
jgi:hypothetical protein